MYKVNKILDFIYTHAIRRFYVAAWAFTRAGDLYALKHLTLGELPDYKARMKRLEKNTLALNMLAGRVVRTLESMPDLWK